MIRHLPSLVPEGLLLCILLSGFMRWRHFFICLDLTKSPTESLVSESLELILWLLHRDYMYNVYYFWLFYYYYYYYHLIDIYFLCKVVGAICHTLCVFDGIHISHIFHIIILVLYYSMCILWAIETNKIETRKCTLTKGAR